MHSKNKEDNIMKSKSLTIYLIAALTCIAFAGSAPAAEYTHIWICQADGTNGPDTPGTPDEPFKSITYALAVADFQAWPQPWHVHIGPGVYDADPAKPAPEREVFPIKLRQAMIFEGADCSDPNNRNVDPNSRVIDGQHLTQGLAPLLLGQNRTGLQIRNLTLQNMIYSEGNGGAVELIECAGKMENCIVKDNQAQNGGGLWLSPRTAAVPMPFHISDCNFAGNTTTSSAGGGVYVFGALTGSVTGCNFAGNSANSRGGGFGISGTLNGNIRECGFTDNSACCSGSGYGGGFHISGSMNGDITDCSFTSNTISARDTNYGGGFCINGTLNGNISDCTFTGNSTTDRDSVETSDGGGFYVGTLNGSVIGCSFTDNAAYHPIDTKARGGGFYIGTLNNDIVDSTFTANMAEGYGASFWCSNTNGDISGCDFVENSGGGAGLAVRLNSTFAGKIENCIFSGHEGIAVWLGSDSDTAAKIRTCLFVAPADPETLDDVPGWAINTNQKTIISNNTIVGAGPGIPVEPSLPSAIYIGFNTQAENGRIFNNIIADNQAGIHVDAGVDMPIRYNLFNNVNEIVCQGETCLGNDCFWLEMLLSNFRHNHCNVDPLFVPGDLIYHLEQDSPCKDAGDPNYMSASVGGETDIDGQPRAMGDCNEIVDIGADEIYFPNCWNYPTHCYGDTDNTGDVKASDFLALKESWYRCYPDPAYNPCVDFDRDGCVKASEFLILKGYWYQSPPADCECCGQTPNCYWPPIVP